METMQVNPYLRKLRKSSVSILPLYPSETQLPHQRIVISLLPPLHLLHTRVVQVCRGKVFSPFICDLRLPFNCEWSACIQKKATYISHCSIPRRDMWISKPIWFIWCANRMPTLAKYLIAICNSSHDRPHGRAVGLESLQGISLIH